MSDFAKLSPGSHIHFMGICGTAMASLAGLLKNMGYKVTGSDTNAYPPMSTQLEKLGIEIKKGYVAANLNPKPDFVVVGNVIRKDYEEAEALLASGIPYGSLPQIMGEAVIADRQSFVITGTHGKTTTTAMMSWIAEVCGKKPGFLVGGIPKNFPFSFREPEADTFVIEGDEYDTAFFDKVPKFIHYRPTDVALTSIEFDHADIYENLDVIKDAFIRLLKLIPTSGRLVYLATDQNIESILEHATCDVWSYGIETGDYQAKITHQDELITRFEVSFKGELLEEVQIHQYGNYNVLNALAAFALAHQNKWPTDFIAKALAQFEGVKRRQEIIGQPGDIIVIEDFAHHPTAVKQTINAIQDRFRGRNVFSVFEPRSATSRRKYFEKQYADAFLSAQEAILAEPFNKDLIPVEERLSSEHLVETVNHKGGNSFCFASTDSIISHLVDRAQPKDVILIMSNGGFDGIYDRLLEQLKKKPRLSEHASL